MPGRLQCQLMFLLVVGFLFVLFALAKNFLLSLGLLSIMAFLIAFSQATTFAIVPYLCPTSNGAVSGLVGSSGAAGGIGIGMIFRQFPYRYAFFVTGVLMISSSFLTLLMNIKGHGTIFTEERSTGEENSSQVVEIVSSTDSDESCKSECDLERGSTGKQPRKMWNASLGSENIFMGASCSINS